MNVGKRYGLAVLPPVVDYRGGQRVLAVKPFGNGVRLTVLGWRLFVRLPVRAFSVRRAA